jgi:hypothetical protein
MDGEQLIKDAAAAIGVGQPDDYKIAPTKHRFARSDGCRTFEDPKRKSARYRR